MPARVHNGEALGTLLLKRKVKLTAPKAVANHCVDAGYITKYGKVSMVRALRAALGWDQPKSCALVVVQRHPCPSSHQRAPPGQVWLPRCAPSALGCAARAGAPRAWRQLHTCKPRSRAAPNCAAEAASLRCGVYTVADPSFSLAGKFAAEVSLPDERQPGAHVSVGGGWPHSSPAAPDPRPPLQRSLVAGHFRHGRGGGPVLCVSGNILSPFHSADPSPRQTTTPHASSVAPPP
jgi:hypothetical protein